MSYAFISLSSPIASVKSEALESRIYSWQRSLSDWRLLSLATSRSSSLFAMQFVAKALAIPRTETTAI